MPTATLDEKKGPILRESIESGKVYALNAYVEFKRRDSSMLCDWFHLQPQSCSMKDSKHRIETGFRFWPQRLV